MNCSTSANATISSNFRAISRRAHPEDRAVQIDVLAAGQLGMEAGADFEQRSHPAVDLDAAFGRLGDSRQDLEQRALAGAVAADDPDDFSRGTSNDTSRSAHRRSALSAACAEPFGETTIAPCERARHRIGNRVAKGAIPLAPQAIPLAEPLDSDRDVAHTTSANVRSIRRKYRGRRPGASRHGDDDTSSSAPGRLGGPEQRPAEPLDHAGHRIQPVAAAATASGTSVPG